MTLTLTDMLSAQEKTHYLIQISTKSGLVQPDFGADYSIDITEILSVRRPVKSQKIVILYKSGVEETLEFTQVSENCGYYFDHIQSLREAYITEKIAAETV